MKILNICNQLRVALKHSALALAVGAAVTFGAGPSAHASLAYTFDSPNETPNLEGWTLLHSATWAKYEWGWFSPEDYGHLGDGWADVETQLGQSPAFLLDGSGDLTCQMIGTASGASAPPLHSADITAAALPSTGFMGVALRDVLTDTYVLWQAHTGTDFSPSNPGWSDLVFTATQLGPYANNGRAYTLDFIDNNTAPTHPGDDHWVILGGATIPGTLAVLRTESQMLTFGSGGVIDQFSQTVTITVPAGTNLATYAPTFTLSPGASCVPASGAIPSPNFSTTNPMTYTVTSEDTFFTTPYSVTVNVAPFVLTYDFNDATLQGWHNRVWDLASGPGWVDLAPNVQTMPGTINGGAIQPPSANDNLFGNPNNHVEYIGGSNDNHLNTQWLRSPVFKLAAGGDLTAQMGAGRAHGPAPANDASVNYAATGDGTTGWKGIALRTVSDGVFVLAKPRTSEGGGMNTVTFTQSELAPFVGIDCTLELINSENGGWGWLSMDNVAIPVPPSTACDMLTYGTNGVISGTNVSLTVPYGTDLATLAPSYTLSPSATAVGPTPNFATANPANYTVTAQDSTTTKTYSVTITVAPVSAACDILSFVFPGQLDTVISGTNISVTVPVSTDVTALTPTYTTSAFAIGSPVSGTSRNFTTAQNYTITAQNGSATKTYTVTVTKGPVPSIFTWNTAVAGTWSESAKWTNDLATGSKPATSGQAFYTLNFTQAGTYTATQDLSNGFVLNQLNFAGAVTLAGTNGLALTANGATLPTVNQNSASGVVIVPPVSLAANVTVAGSGNGQVSLGGLVSGTGQLIKNSSGGLQLRGHTVQNTYSGGTIVNSGTLQLGYYDGVTTHGSVDPMGSGPVTLNSGAMISFDRATASNALTVNGGTIANYNGWGSTWSGPITLNATLTADLPNQLSCNGVISGTGGIIKTNGGPLVLSGINTYSGDTTVNGGTLLVNGSAIKDTGKLVIGGGKVQATGTETVNTLFFGAVQQAAGTWGFTGSGATNIDTVHFSGTTGVVNVLTGPAIDYATWAASYLPTDVSVPTGDPDGDGMTNQQEYAFGLNPTSGASVSPITAPLNQATGMFSYTRRATPALTGLTYTVLTSTNLVTWTLDAGAVPESVVTAGDVQTVTFTVSNPAVDGKLFVQVKAAPAP